MGKSNTLKQKNAAKNITAAKIIISAPTSIILSMFTLVYMCLKQNGAGDEIRTRDIHVGNVGLYR